MIPDIGISQRRLGELTGIDFTYLSRLERGDSGAIEPTIDKIAMALGADTRDELYRLARRVPIDVLDILATNPAGFDAVRALRPKANGARLKLPPGEWTPEDVRKFNGLKPKRRKVRV